MTVHRIHPDRIAIPPGSLERWQAVASGLGIDGWTLAGELRLLAGDPSRHNVGRCIKCARMLGLEALADELAALL